MKKLLVFSYAFIVTFSCLLAPGFLRAADEQKVDEQKLTLARDVIKATRADAVVDSMLPQIKQMVSSMAPGNLAPEEKATFEKMQEKVLELSMESAKEMIKKMDIVYAETFTIEELKAIKAFYESPEGRSMVDKQSLLMQKMMPLIQDMQRDLIPKIQKVAEEFAKEAQNAKASKSKK